MIRINNFTDLTDYQLSKIKFQFNLNNMPGSLIYNPLTKIEIKNDNHINPYNKHSPFYGLSKGETINIELSENNVSQSGIITDFVRNTGSIELIIEDDILNTLNNTTALLNYSNLTPIEIATILCEIYAIEYNQNYIGVIDNLQRSLGLIYDFGIFVNDSIKLFDYFNSINEAGFMRSCVHNNQMYFVSNFFGVPKIEIIKSDIRSYPKMSERLNNEYNGGECDTPLGTVVYDYNISYPENKISLNYASGNIILYNLSGAKNILYLYNQCYDYRPFELELPNNVVSLLEPGDIVLFQSGIIANEQKLGRLTSINIQNNYTNCIFEVKNG